MTTPDIEGFILAGGASSRMGVDKSRLRLGGSTFVEMIASALAPLCARVRLVSSRPEALLHGLAVVPDAYEGRGALGGLHAALRACEAPWAAVVSCDLPFVTRALFERLASLRDDETAAVAPIQEDGREQPLCALYSPRACAPVAEELIASGELRPRVLLRSVRTRRVAFDELRALEGAGRFFENVNTPEDFARVRSRTEG